MENELTTQGLKEGGLLLVAFLFLTFGLTQLQEGNIELGSLYLVAGAILTGVREYFKLN